MAKHGLVFNIQHYSVHDGPGIRTTVFVKGCPLRCRWCSNPESQKMIPEIAWTAQNCIGCKCCENKLQRIHCHFTEKGLSYDQSADVLSEEVRAICPSQALHVIGEYKTVEEVVAEVERDQVFYNNSGGGITISGGEPLLQHEFTNAVLAEAKRRNIHTAIETTCFAEWKILKQTAALVDYLIMDIKHMDAERHKEYTGVSNQIILDNFVKLTNEFPKLHIHVRTPVIPNFNDNEEDILNIVHFIKGRGNVSYELLKYHRYGVAKYETLGKEYPMGDVEVSEELFLKLKEITL